MLITTLVGVPGRSFAVLGFVCAQTHFGGLGAGNTQQMIQQLIDQASRFGADGIIDVKTIVGGGDYGFCVMTGTAVKFT